MQFGGIIAFANSSDIQIMGIGFNSYEKWLTRYTNYTGQIIGAVSSSLSKIQVQNICLKLIISFEQDPNSIDSFGIIGYSEGNIKLQQCTLQFQSNNGTYNSFGTVGYISSLCKNATFYDLYIQMNMAQSICGKVSALSGILNAQNWAINSINIYDSNISGSHGGLIAGNTINIGSVNNIQIMYSQVYVNINSNANACAGIIFGWVGPSYALVIIQNIIMKNNIIVANSTQVPQYTNTFSSLLGGYIGEMYNSSNVSIQQTSQYNTSIISTLHLTSQIGGIAGNVFNLLVIQNTNLTLCTITSNANSQAKTGGFIGFIHTRNRTSQLIQIQNSQCNQLNLSITSTNYSYSGGLVGYMESSNLQFSNVYLSDIVINALSFNIYAKITVNFCIGCNITLNQVISQGTNLINLASISNCEITNIDTIDGC
ncbi:Hypothetical_protein [Hexamita inflata]|uniref:Hypothetical_protein n=1 Tax=Hexamita inflata TaxID=28002 RepID=A0AA86PKK0_9EUKA|nr:Hypothetical protein HINF_LOCUS29014 [Hexamita inflata]CAI9941371.1 Hypothetical protein HINF_LOCUS29016 [Hexamita inflata]